MLPEGGLAGPDWTMIDGLWRMCINMHNTGLWSCNVGTNNDSEDHSNTEQWRAGRGEGSMMFTLGMERHRRVHTTTDGVKIIKKKEKKANDRLWSLRWNAHRPSSTNCTLFCRDGKKEAQRGGRVEELSIHRRPGRGHHGDARMDHNRETHERNDTL